MGATSLENYINKAIGFQSNLKRAEKSLVQVVTEGVVRYKKSGKYIDITKDGKIISFGIR
ncbi:MAG: hypothetical protein K0R72_438 [Clostridia bacterium]|nr:hypothetical protein [Clostridia bacterium]